MKFYICKNCKEIYFKPSDDKINIACCSNNLEELEANKTDASKEKHVPVYEIKDGKINITVGEIPHPMTKEHYIEFIILASEDEYLIKKLTPNDDISLTVPYFSKYKEIYAYCNIHGLFKIEIK